MTLRMYLFLRKLRKAQVHPDWIIQLFDGDNPHVETYNQSEKDTRVVSLTRYRYHLDSYCEELERQGLLYRSGQFGKMNVTQPGWDYFQITVFGLLRFTVLDILVPVLVSWLTARLVAG